MSENNCPQCGSNDILEAETNHYCRTCRIKFEVKREYLTEAKFDKFIKNDFAHVQRSLSFIRGAVFASVPILIAILGLLVFVIQYIK